MGNIEECEGYATFGSEKVCSWFRKDMTCPCSICLIKMIYTNACIPLRKHTEIIYRLRELKRKGI